ncbi:uncharacterized protein PV09_03842 [Verruconis gallopava]|uniref:Uncharacterized protein n=1 Tax=Verruconis gallopava TaxID=253628 RepID=A0A0D2AFQ1_9PEZI|nr:uncharacterized protein PV09_03842 [Verruconis gallopava]KIW05320.1 hypothetical protein PV09_03842 [Verruconis gallopava]
MVNKTPNLGEKVTYLHPSPNDSSPDDEAPEAQKQRRLEAAALQLRLVRRERLRPLLEIYNEENGPANETTVSRGDSSTPQPSPTKLDAFAVLQKHADTDPTLKALGTHVNGVPDWVDWSQIARGHDVFYRYAVVNLFGLAYQSLFVRLAASRPVEVLLRTGGFSTAASKRRGFETGQWNLEVTKDVASLQPGGPGWESTVRVRLLHSAVRSRIRVT